MSNQYSRGVLLLLLFILGGCQLKVSTEGGRGNVTSASGLINCGVSGNQCSVDYSEYAGSQTSYTEYLYAQAERGYRFSHWSGDCSGSAVCSVKLSKTSGNKAVSAVFVEEPLSEEKDLVSFKFLKADNPTLPSDVSGDIDPNTHNVTLAVPTGVNLQSLVANFEITGVDVTVNDASQESSVTINDFSDSLYYQVVAEDDSKQGYLVSVSQVDYQAKALSSFKFSMQDNAGFEQDSIGEIDEQNHAIKLLVAKDVDVSSLIARFETSGQTVTVNGIEQYSGVTANNYTSDLTYRVTAYDNSVQDYVISVSESNCLEQPWQGNYTITSAQDIEALMGYTSVTGTLSIGSSSTPSTGLTNVTGLECLNTLGTLNVAANPDLTNLDGLSGVTKITGNLSIYNNPSLTSISGLENLATVANITISNNASLPNLNGLEKVGQVSDVDLYGLATLTDLSAIANLHVTSKMKLRSLTALETLPVFTNLANPLWLEIIGNTKLTSLAGFEQLTQASILNISQNDSLTNLTGLSGLTSATSFGLVSNANLESLVGVEKLSVLTTLTVQGNLRLSSFDGLSGLNSIFSGLTLIDNSSLSDLSALTNLTSLSGNVTVRGNDVLPNFTGLDNVSTGLSTLTIDNNDGLENLQGLASVPSATKVIIKNNDVLANLQGLNGLTTTSLLQLENNPSLASLAGLDALTKVNGRVALLNNDGMFSTSGASALQTISGDFDIERNNRLTHIDGFEQLTSVGATSIRLNNDLVNLDGFLSVTEIKGSLEINGNTRLLDLFGMGNVVSIGTSSSHDLNIRGGALDHLSLRSLESVAGDLLVDNTSLVDFDLPQLCSVGQNFQVTENGALCTSKIETVRDQVVNCSGIGGTVTITNNMTCN
ncbi:InlB B-repeat-containing protein [Litoribrevibacter albus]|uniref:Bacterial repeat domain-containing protein n=1 Tax=Litoribrevibacter albus TaxID=1473156 RepID=A0AA37S8L8_9GAMM|nr:hypothetical protein [Litoribrevibacter albus]GLQ30451.1 hypothetical protein GCM10007876_09290 [Litoribrevibacter albus]